MNDHKGFRIKVLLAEALFWHFVVRNQGTSFFLAILKKRFPHLNLSIVEKLRLSSAVVSTAHSLTLVVIACRLFYEFNFLKKDWTDEELILGFHPLGRASCELFVAYLAQDTLWLLKNIKYVDEMEMLVHHVVYLIIALFNLPNHYFVYPFMWLTLGELSTPFVNFREILTMVGLKDSKYYVYNGFALLISFFSTRVVLYGFGLKHLFETRSIWMKESKILSLVVLGLFSMYALNNFWFLRILRGAVKVLKAYKTV